MLSKCFRLTNADGRAFIRAWVLDPSLGGRVVRVIGERPGNFFNIIVAPFQAARRPFVISLPYKNTDCLPSFFGSVQHLEKTLNIKVDL